MVEHHLAMVGVAGSNPVFRLIMKFKLQHFRNREIAQLGRASRSGRGGRKFESCFPDSNINNQSIYWIDYFFDSYYFTNNKKNTKIITLKHFKE